MPYVNLTRQQPIVLLTSSTVADLFLFVRSLQVPIAMESPSQIALLIRLKAWGGRGEAHMGKVNTVGPISNTAECHLANAGYPKHDGNTSRCTIRCIGKSGCEGHSGCGETENTREG